MGYFEQLNDIIDFCDHKFSDKQPSAWAEENMAITIGPYPGKLSLDRTPYSREILDCLSPYHSCTNVALMGGSQWGKSRTVIEPCIAYYVSEYPLPIGYLTGHSDLSDEAMQKLDQAFDNSGLRPLIKAHTLRKRNTRSGDTNKSKEFPLGSLVAGSATNHKLLRQYTWGLVIADDIDAAKLSSKESGNTLDLIERRVAAYGSKSKILWVSTPEIKGLSNIEYLYEKGDKRRYHIPCQCCGTAITLEWATHLKNSEEKAGFVWDTDNGELVAGSVRYRCQECGDHFDDSNKFEFNKQGVWIPTAKPKDPNFVSFHLSCFYAMPGMFNWEYNVRKYLEGAPDNGQPADESKLKTFYNLCCGLPFESQGEGPKANTIQKNQGRYDIGVIPESLSMADGNGRIVLLTCAADLNGKQEDGRLDYQVIAFAENGSSYNILHGSIGTFKPAILKRKDDELEDREHWTYEEHKPLSIWPEFEKVLNQQFKVDAATPRTMGITICALDTGKTYNNLAYTFIDKMNNKCPGFVQGVKGRADEGYTIEFEGITKDLTLFRGAKEREDLWILETGLIKDRLQKNMNLNWNEGEAQPSGFMNFPRASNDLYSLNSFFHHFESEKPVIVSSKGKAMRRWEKVQSNSQNHQWDCMVYNMAIKEILIHIIGQKYKLKDYSWAQYVKNALEFFTKSKL